MSSKAAYRKLDRLINNEWTSSGNLNYQFDANNNFRGFYGQYEMVIKTDNGKYMRKVNFSKYSDNKLKIIIASK